MKKRRYTPKAIAPVVDPKRMNINKSLLRKLQSTEQTQVMTFEPYEPPAGVLPSGANAMAMDSTSYALLNQTSFAISFAQYHFPGYPILAMWSQFPEYRKISEVIAKEMTRKWIKIVSTSDDDADKTDKIKIIENAIEKYKLQAKFRQCAELDGFFGRGQLYIDLNMPGGKLASEDPNEIATPLIKSSTKIKKDSLVGFNVIEPIWTYPGAYNADNPLAADYYRPTQWYVMGKTVHASRLLMFVSREVPDLLKAAYNFGGLSMSQLARPYVENWIRTRDSIGDLVHSFSISGVKTDMSSVLGGVEGSDEQFISRADLFNQMRDNRGLMLIDKDGEEFFQFNTPLSGLSQLQAQAQEQQASVASIPLVKLLGITPSGLNASSDGEIRVFYDMIYSMQEHIFKDNLKTAFDVIQLSELGAIDPDITFVFESLHVMTDLEKATIRKTNADTDAVLITSGEIAPEEGRQRLASDPDSGYNNIDVDMEIEPGSEDLNEEGE